MTPWTFGVSGSKSRLAHILERVALPERFTRHEVNEKRKTDVVGDASATRKQYRVRANPQDPVLRGVSFFK